MDRWAKAPPTDRAALFTETAAKKDISPEIVEKDFWVCWTLLQISRLTHLPRLIFKGGTSLSKAFGIIKRFSEDIDLVINRHELGFNDETDPANQEATNLRNRTIEKLKETCFDVIAKEFAPRLRSQVSSIIGDPGWILKIDPSAPEPDTVDFQYPKGLPDPQLSGYIRRAVRLELGCRGDQIPLRGGDRNTLRCRNESKPIRDRRCAGPRYQRGTNILGKGNDSPQGILPCRGRERDHGKGLPTLRRPHGHF